MAERTHIADEGAECPAFIAKAAFENEAEENIHTAKFEDPAAPNEPVETNDTSIQMVIDDGGGIIHYDNTTTIYRRIFNDKEQTIAVFRDTVDETTEDFERKEIEFEFDYDAGRDRVEFESQD